MIKHLSKIWWLFLLRGVFTVLFGITALAWPELSLLVLITVFGVYTLIGGIFLIIAGLLSIKKFDRWWLVLLDGIFNLIVGMFVLEWPGVTLFTLIFIVAFWAIVLGIIQVIFAIAIRKEIKNEWLIILSGALSFLLGVILLSRPVSAITILGIIVGFNAIIFGTFGIAISLKLKEFNKVTRGK